MDNQPITQTPEPCCKNDRWFKISAIIIGILIVIGLFGNIYLLLKKQNTPVAQPIPTPIPTQTVHYPISISTPFPASAEIVNWKTYTNSSIGYSIKYPDGWNLSTAVSEPFGNITIQNYLESELTKDEITNVFLSGNEPTDKIYINLTVNEKLILKNEKLIDWLKKEGQYSSDMSGDPISVKEATIAGNPGLILNYSGTGDHYEFHAGNRVFSAYFGPHRTSQSKIFDQILSTFRFD